MAEMPAVVIIYYTIEHYGRKMTVSSFLSVGGLFCIGSKFMSGTLATALSLLAKLCIAGAFKVTIDASISFN